MYAGLEGPAYMVTEKVAVLGEQREKEGWGDRERVCGREFFILKAEFTIFDPLGVRCPQCRGIQSYIGL